MGAFKTPHNKVMKLTNMQAKLLLFAALGFILGYCQQEDIISEDSFQTPALRRTSELDQAGYGWRRRRGDHARRERQGKQNLRNAERGNKERQKLRKPQLSGNPRMSQLSGNPRMPQH